MTDKLTQEQVEETIKAVHDSYILEEAAKKLGIKRQALYLRLANNGYRAVRGKLRVEKVEKS